MSSRVLRENHDGIAVLQLNRPRVGNAIDLELARSLTEAVAEVAEDGNVRCVLLRGAGERFCVGGDLAAAPGDAGGAYVAELVGLAHSAVLGLASLPVPVVAAVQGAAAGAGLALTLLADTVIAADRTVFLAAYGGVGLSPDCGTSWLLPRVVGLQRSRRLLLQGRRLDAQDALDWGLVEHVVVADSVCSAAMAVARDLADGPHPALGLTARLLRGDLESLARHLDREAADIAVAAESADSVRLIDRLRRRVTVGP